MLRALIWVTLLPFAAASVLVGHAVAYRVTGTPAGDLHGYLAHAPQVVAILATLALLGLAADTRARRTSPVPLALLAIAAFVAQEHVERLIHTGDVPILLASPALWVGIALQLPLTLAVWWLARWLASDLAASTRRVAPGTGALTLTLRIPAAGPWASRVPTAASGRGPPATF
jgi:hypothetical protein